MLQGGSADLEIDHTALVVLRSFELIPEGSQVEDTWRNFFMSPHVRRFLPSPPPSPAPVVSRAITLTDISDYLRDFPSSRAVVLKALLSSYDVTSTPFSRLTSCVRDFFTQALAAYHTCPDPPPFVFPRLQVSEIAFLNPELDNSSLPATGSLVHHAIAVLLTSIYGESDNAEPIWEEQALMLVDLDFPSGSFSFHSLVDPRLGVRGRLLPAVPSFPRSSVRFAPADDD